MISKGYHVKFERFVSLADLYCRDHLFFRSMYNKKLLDFVLLRVKEHTLSWMYEPKMAWQMALEMLLN